MGGGIDCSNVSALKCIISESFACIAVVLWMYDHVFTLSFNFSSFQIQTNSAEGVFFDHEFTKLFKKLEGIFAVRNLA